MFKRAWFRKVDAAPPNLKWKRGYDLGISKNATADYTASLKVAYDSAGNMYIDGGFRRRIEYPEQRRYILGRIQAESNTEHGIELSANGNAVIQDLRTDPATRGRALRGIKVNGDKVTQALPWIALAEEGKVFLVRGPWNTEFIDEAAAFPSGTHDDQIDATSIAVRMHREPSYGFYIF
ncbi:MAG: phage terminase large subunit [Chloracidobacterium sp.]|nr:phage terminase large subunit [Chloracidobacterium sp.]